MNDLQPARIEGGRRLRGFSRSSEPEQPLISIITVVYNRARYLSRAIESVVMQTYPNIEYIVIDGGSTDGSLDIIHNFDHAIDYWVSEPDGGMYEALNKGIARSRGDLIGIVHSDDFLITRDVISRVAGAFQRDSFDIYHGNAIATVEEQYFCHIQNVISDHARILETHTVIVHPASFIQRRVYDELGGYDTAYRSAADYDLFIRCVKAQHAFKHLEFTICGMSLGGADRVSNNCYAHLEAYRSHRSHATGNHNRYLLSYLECRLRRLIRSIIKKRRIAT